MQKTIKVPRGKNIGRTVIASFQDYSKIAIKAVEVTRDAVNKQSIVELTYI